MVRRVIKIIIVSAILAVSLIVFKNLDHASAKENKARPTLSHSIMPATGSSAGRVITGFGNLISSDPDGLGTSVSLIDLNSGAAYNAGATTTLFKAASTAKVLAAVDYLHETETGQASLSQQIDGVNAEQLAQQMIEVSDDSAWADINNYLGDQQQGYADQIGLSSFTGGEYNTMTAPDMAKLLAMLYEGKLLNTQDRALLLSFMTNTTSTNLIQAALPDSATVYHKYGQLWGYLNDAAIVSYQNHQYVLVVFTNNPDGTTDEYSDQVNLIHQISQTAFQDITNNLA